MMRRTGWMFLGVAIWMAACRFVPGLAAGWQVAVAGRALWALHRASAAAPFPLLEPLALAALYLCLGRRGPRRLAAIFAVYALLWYPAYWTAPAETQPVPGAAQLERLCDDLIDKLSAGTADFDGAIDLAGDVAGLPGARVKAARYPEWMSALGAAGLFSPWTGEVIVDAAASPACVPFTCVHELMHLRGIADEGAANVAAWRACMRRGGAFADSARLWALRYGLEMLCRADPDAGRRALERMEAPLVRLFTPFAAAPDSPNPLTRLLGIGRSTSDYSDLARWLAVEY